jgi:hypothetical protein
MEVEQPLLAPVKDKRVVESGVNAADSADSDNFVHIALNKRCASDSATFRSIPGSML